MLAHSKLPHILWPYVSPMCCHKSGSSGKRILQLRIYFPETDMLVKFGGGIFLVNDCGKAQPTVGVPLLGKQVGML